MANERQPFSLTYVTYQPGDPIGLFCALLALAPPFIVVAYATLLVSRREAHLFYIFAGQLANVALNAVLKKAINQPRPANLDPHHSGPGMPSDHSQFMAFWACYGALFLLCYVPQLGRAGWRPALALAMSALAVSVAASRVYLSYHTIPQVVAGLGVGCAFAGIWFAAYAVLLRKRLGDWVAASAACRYLMIRDCAHVHDVVAWEYECIMHKLTSASPVDRSR